MSVIRPGAVDVTSALRGIDFPASKEDLIRYLHRLPERQYNSIADFEKAVGEII
jgi:hypothetical protein